MARTVLRFVTHRITRHPDTDAALRAVELDLSEELLASLDEIFPGPGPSPEAFTW